MKWSKDADTAISRVPFFVRRRVRKKVEEEAARSHATEVTMEHVAACQRRFLDNMEREVKGYQVETCFGPGGCPNRATHEELAADLEEILASASLRDFLRTRVSGPLKMHHEFRVTVADCPNACSRPQIADVGIIAALQPTVSAGECSRCGACVHTCKESALNLSEDSLAPTMDPNLCVSCGQCVGACPTGTLASGATGWRVLLGGKLGRHPQLAAELPGIYSKEEVLEILRECLAQFMEQNVGGERFGDILNRTGLDFFQEKTVPKKKRTCA